MSKFYSSRFDFSEYLEPRKDGKTTCVLIGDQWFYMARVEKTDSKFEFAFKNTDDPSLEVLVTMNYKIESCNRDKIEVMMDVVKDGKVVCHQNFGKYQRNISKNADAFPLSLTKNYKAGSSSIRLRWEFLKNQEGLFARKKVLANQDETKVERRISDEESRENDLRTFTDEDIEIPTERPASNKEKTNVLKPCRLLRLRFRSDGMLHKIPLFTDEDVGIPKKMPFEVPILTTREDPDTDEEAYRVSTKRCKELLQRGLKCTGQAS